MKTIVWIGEDLLDEAKQHALNTDRTLAQLIQDALIVLMAQEKSQQSPGLIELPTFNGNGVHEGVNIDSNANLRDRMDGMSP